MKKFTSITIIFLVFALFCTAQVTDFPCYAITKNSNSENMIFGYSSENNEWSQISSTQSNNIVAIAADSNNGILYAFENNSEQAGVANLFGMIDPITRNFVPIGSPEYGNGVLGEVLLNNIVGLAFDNATNTMYALHSNAENSELENDLLFKIDVSTGQFIPNAMFSATNLSVDYTYVEEVYDNENNILIYSVKDIAINPQTYKLYAVHATENSNSILSVIDSENGTIDNVVYDIYENNLQSLSFTANTDLYGTISAITPSEDKLLYIDYKAGNVTVIANLDFKCMDCFHQSVNFGSCANEMSILENTIASGLYQSITLNDDADIVNIVAENSTVVFAAKESINLQNIEIPANCDLALEIRPCGL